jgi:hypothetical protein
MMSGDGPKKPDESTSPATPQAIERDPIRARATRAFEDRSPAGSPENLPAQSPVNSPAPKVRATVAFENPTEQDALSARTQLDRVDPRALAVTIESESTEDEAEVAPALTVPGFGGDHCPVCGALAANLARCAECGYAFADPRIGQIVGGRYRVDALIGAGGFGRVYRGTHLTLGEPVAIKFLLEEFSNRPEARARFRREAVALAKIRHPSIVAVHDYGEHLGELFMVMELVRGTQLFDRITDEHGKLMPVPRACALIDQLLGVLEVAHGMGIVHRDLKPENVMLLDTEDRADHLKVLDFGLALMDDRAGADRLTATRAVQGTPIYMSPEQCRGRDVTDATDIYAVGAMAFELLCGEPPFEGDSVPDLMAKHMYVEPPALAERGQRPTIAPGIEAVIRSALAKRADERPSARAFRERLAEALRGTDEVSRAADQVQLRVEHTALSRDQRALVEASSSREASGASIIPPPADGAMSRVFAWGIEASRGDSLRSALAVHGVNVVLWKNDAPPDEAVLTKRPAKAMVVSGPDAAARVRTLRAHGPTAKLPILVVESAVATTELIRAGASDVSPAGAVDEALCKQVVRLIRRGR